jgi:radical SAM superfamily enzyme YgiQ (UPF0313 family)
MGVAFPLVSFALCGNAPLLSGLMLDNGLALLAAQLLRDGHRPRIFDYSRVSSVERVARDGRERFVSDIIDELDAFVRDEHAPVMGFKLFANGFRDSVHIAAELRRRHPKLSIVAGGPQVGWFGAAIFDYARETEGSDVFSALVAGEGDAAIRAVANGASPSEIPGALHRTKGMVRKNPAAEIAELDAMPYPVYDANVYPDLHDDKVLIPVLEDTRNCDWRKCTFCVHPRLGGRFRERSLASLVDEAIANEASLGARVFRLGGPDPCPALVNALAGALPEGFAFSAFGRADGLGYEYERLAGRMAGGVFIGLESADPTILRGMLKTLDPSAYLANAERMITELKARGIGTVAACIVPGPNETDESMQRTFDFLARTEPDFAPVLPIAPMPGTPLARSAGREGSGVRVDDGFVSKLIRYELDLLRPSSEWPKPPWQVMVNGEWCEDPFSVTAKFGARLRGIGLEPLSDEIVLMAHLFHGGLSAEQRVRRRQCVDFNRECRDALASGDGAFLRRAVRQMNATACGNQLKSHDKMVA